MLNETASRQVGSSIVSDQRGLILDARLMGRPPTSLGKQDHHVSAFALLKQGVFTAILGKPLDVGIAELCAMMEVYLDLDLDQDSAQALFEQVKQHLQALKYPHEAFASWMVTQTPPEGHEEYSELAHQCIIESRCSILEQVLTTLIENYVTAGNRLQDVCFPVEGNIDPPDGESTRVSEALRYLGGLSGMISDTELDDITTHILHLFWYPHIPSQQLIDLDTNKGRRQWLKIQREQRYKREAKPRNNAIEGLEYVLRKHIILTFLAFPFLRGEQQEAIIERFIDKALDYHVKQNPSWREHLTPHNVGVLKAHVLGNLPTIFLEHGDVESPTTPIKHDPQEPEVSDATHQTILAQLRATHVALQGVNTVGLQVDSSSTDSDYQPPVKERLSLGRLIQRVRTFNLRPRTARQGNIADEADARQVDAILGGRSKVHSQHEASSSRLDKR